MFCVIYNFKIKDNKISDFLRTWKNLSGEVRKKYPAYGASVHLNDRGDVTVYAQWPSEEIWNKFWVLKELSLESLTQLKSFMVGNAEVQTMQLLHTSLKVGPQVDYAEA